MESNEGASVTAVTGKEKKAKRNKISKESSISGEATGTRKRSKNSTKGDSLNSDDNTADDIRAEITTKSKEKKRRRNGIIEQNNISESVEVSTNGDEVIIPLDSENNIKKKSMPTNDAEGAKTADEEDDGSLNQFRISDQMKKQLKLINIRKLFEVQKSSFDSIFDGNDLIARSHTGSGKTLAFALPVIESKFQNDKFKSSPNRAPQIICLLPTRELAMQVSQTFESIKHPRAGYRVVCIYGGTPEQSQVQSLRRGVDVVVGTPGRLLDLMTRKLIQVSKIDVVILDEADQLLKFGFQDEVDKILSLVCSVGEDAECLDRSKQNENVQSKSLKETIQFLLFSATMPKWVNTIISNFMNKNRITLDLVSGKTTSSDAGGESSSPLSITHYAIGCSPSERKNVLDRVIYTYGDSKDKESNKILIFCETKSQANEVSLHSSIASSCNVIHGDIAQSFREHALQAFRLNKFRCLVATDVAARGVHIDGIGLVIQMSVPKDLDTYLHRAGRTGRAGKSGNSVVFFGRNDGYNLQQISQKNKIQFIRVGVPQPISMADSVLLNVIRRTENMNDTSNSFFSRPISLCNGQPEGKGPIRSNGTISPTSMEIEPCGSSMANGFMSDKLEAAAEKLINKLGVTETVKRMMLQLKDFNDIASLSTVSTLTGKNGMQSYILTTKNRHSLSAPLGRYCLRRMLENDETLLSRISSITATSKFAGVCFDIPCTMTTKFEEQVSKACILDKSVTVEPLNILPELVEEDTSYSNDVRQGGRGQNNRYSGRRDFSRGSLSNSYDRGGGSSLRRGGRGDYSDRGRGRSVRGGRLTRGA